jgi:tRNA (adenine-N(1)-)-methyltransferase non-catalytic subunit
MPMPCSQIFSEVRRPPPVIDGGLVSSKLSGLVLDELKSPAFDNSELFDHNTAQSLTHNDIQSLKTELSGEQLARKVAESSNTFHLKTEYSREKYLKKKMKKYHRTVTIVRSTSRSICEFYSSKKPERILFLRPDTLSQILTLANIRAYSRTLVLDTVMGLVSGSIVERQGGYGDILCGFSGRNHVSRHFFLCYGQGGLV